MNAPLSRVPLREIVRRFAQRTLSPIDYVDSFIDAIATREPVVKAFTYFNPAALRAAAKTADDRYRKGVALGPLDGIPVGIKDIIDTADMPTAYGSRLYAGYQPAYDAACVAALRRGGALPAGKTVTTEFAYGASGPTTNPHDPARSPGGSSSGSAATVGAGMLPLALGTQTAGSILRPASYCGAVGFKPSHGALSVSGIHPTASSLDHLGVFTQDVDSAWLAASFISEGAGSVPGNFGLIADAATPLQARKPVRLIHLHLGGWNELNTGEQAEMQQTLSRLRAQGVEIVDRHTAPAIAQLETVLDHALADSVQMLTYDMRYPYIEYETAHADLLSEPVVNRARVALTVSNTEYAQLLRRRAQARHAVDAVLADFHADGFVLPSATGAAPVGLGYTGSRTYPTYWSWLGYPAISLPVMHSDRLPWGLQLSHGAHKDREVCEVAAWVMSALHDVSQGEPV